MDQPSDPNMTLQYIAELDRRRQVAESLRGTLAMLNSNLPVENILSHIAIQSQPLLNADASAIYSLQLNGMLTVQASVGLESDYIRYANIPLGASATGQAVLTQLPVYFEDLNNVTLMKTIVGTQLADLIKRLAARYKSVLAVPLLIRSEIYGALTLYFKEEHKVSEEDIALAKDFSAQAALAIENTRLRVRVEQDAATAERNRLARELHDSVTQNLFSANLIAEVLPTIWQRDPKQGMEGLNEIRQLTSGALAEMRLLLLELRPHALEDVRLEELFQQLATLISGRIRKPVDLEITGQANLPLDVRMTFYRIAQEALNNIVKHSEANQISLRLICAPINRTGQCPQAEMTIIDDGCGFEDPPDTSGHLGFGIMKERVQAIQATLSIQSQIDCGTRISLIWKAAEEKKR